MLSQATGVQLILYSIHIYIYNIYKTLISRIQYGVLKHFALWGIFWCEGNETFCS